MVVGGLEPPDWAVGRDEDKNERRARFPPGSPLTVFRQHVPETGGMSSTTTPRLRGLRYGHLHAAGVRIIITGIVTGAGGKRSDACRGRGIGHILRDDYSLVSTGDGGLVSKP